MKMIYNITMLLLATSAIINIYRLFHPLMARSYTIGINVITPFIVLIYLAGVIINKKKKAVKNVSGSHEQFSKN